ncbi:MAG: hypothetical protein HYX47_00470 [Burkholderiales bacterium]|nr:hypothetical protein [Burkholderiales bacterium]
MAGPPHKKTSSLDRPFVAGDSIPAPLAVEHDTETAWALFNNLSEQQNVGFAATEPAPIMRREAPARPQAPQRKATTVEEVILESRRSNRVCPLPARWVQLYEMLPGKTHNQPPPPITGPAWRATPSMSKRMCMRDHIEWAGQHGGLDEVMAFLKMLPEEQWHHMGD